MMKKIQTRTLLTMIFFLITFTRGPLFADSYEEFYRQGLIFSQQGNTQGAIRKWEQALDLEGTKTEETQIRLRMGLAAAFQSQGNYQSAWKQLQSASSLAERSENPVYLSLVLSGEGDFFLASGNPDWAKQKLQKATQEARKIQQPLVLASVLNNLGNLLLAQKEFPSAILNYQESIRLAQSKKDYESSLRTTLNLIRAYQQAGKSKEATVQLQDAFLQMENLPYSYQRSLQWISLGKLAQDLSFMQLAYQAWKKALSVAESLTSLENDQLGKIRSYAYGYLGSLYETQKRNQEGIDLTRKALFFAQQSRSPHLLYRWQWQLGRLFQANGNRKKGILLYRQAVNNLQSVRSEVNSGVRLSSSFRKSQGRLYYELVDLLLQSAKGSFLEKDRTRYLLEARNVMEQFKGAELQDYFQDECVTNTRSKIKKLDQLDPQTATLYPIPLKNRLVLLLSFSEGIQQIVVSVDEETLKNNVDQFRHYLQTRGTFRFLSYAKNLFQWLIAPIQKELEKKGIDTLVIVPDGKLRTIPFSALYDGKKRRFLIQNYALAITPSLDLTDPKKLRRENLQVLLNGLSEPISGFAPLPNVPYELENIKKVIQGRVRLNHTFTVESLTRELQSSPYSIVHIASHGQFDSQPRKTFLLTYQGKMTMDQLSTIIRDVSHRKQPIELLVLSACQTALGDDRAALGLAGVAIKAGARSALASLWFVDDLGTSFLMNKFYHQLQNSDLSKAKALQLAQQSLLKQRRFRHPAYWASFLLIGNWL